MAKAKKRKVKWSLVGTERSIMGVVRNADAKLSDIAPHAAAKLGLVGGFECLDPAKDNEVLSPEMKLADLPEEVALVSEHTPAR